MGDVTDLGKVKTFPITQELFDRLNDVLSDYNGEVSLCEAVGTLDLLKAALIDNANKEA